MYSENEILVLVEPHGRKDTRTYLPVGTEVTFIKVVHNDQDLSLSLVVVQYEDRIFPLKEVKVKPKNKNKLKEEFKKFNKTMMLRNPELKKYHPNLFLRYYYRLLFYIKGLFNDKAN